MSGTYLREDDYQELKDNLLEGYTVKQTAVWANRSLGLIYHVKNTKSYEEYQEKYQKRLVPKKTNDNLGVILIEMLGIMRGIAYDQSTREFSGTNWFNEIDKRLTELKERIAQSIY